MENREENSGPAAKCAIYTLGCKANQADSDRLAADLHAAGFDLVNYRNIADIYIINTCTVTGKAAYQSRQAVRRFIKRHPGSKVIITGCDVEVEKEILEGIEGVFYIAGNSEKSGLPELIAMDARCLMLDACEQVKRESSIEYRISRARPFLKIQDGCNSGCAYCIVPRVRGGLKSEPAETIIDSIEALHRRGCYEVVLTGIHIGKYGAGLRNKIDLTGLLKRILKESGISRLRLSSLEPDEIDTEFIDTIANSGGRICPHLHIPLQSGCDETLKRMNRGYTTDQYEQIIHKIRASVPNVNIGADIITGFPGESELEFDTTYNFVESLPVTYLHVFSYSDREGTDASKMKEKIGEGIKRERTKALRGLSTEKRRDYLRSNIGREVTVVFDRQFPALDCFGAKAPRNDNKLPSLRAKRSPACRQARNPEFALHKGVSENYINVLVKKGITGANQHRVKLTDLAGESMIGTIVSERERDTVFDNSAARPAFTTRLYANR